MTRFFLSVILIGLIYCSGNAAHDEKFFKKAAEIVWSMELPEFNPTTQIPDTSLYNNESAIILAAYKNVDVKLREQRNITKFTSTGRAYTNAIDAKILTRVMIKLKDSKSVEEYSEFDIESKDKESILNYSYQYNNILLLTLYLHNLYNKHQIIFPCIPPTPCKIHTQIP